MKKSYLIIAGLLIILIVCLDQWIGFRYMFLAYKATRAPSSNFSDGMGTDRTIENNQALKEEKINWLKNNYPELIIAQNELDSSCGTVQQYFSFMRSNRLGDAQEIDNSFLCTDSGMGYYVKFYVFKDPAKALMGLNERLATSSVRYSVFGPKGSKTGKRYGDLSIYTGDWNTANMLDMAILHKNLFVEITIGARDKIAPPQLLDEWAEKALNKMKIAAQKDGY